MSAHAGIPQIRSRPRHDTGWQEHARCVDANPRIFFDPARYTEALTVCAQCPVKAPCRELGRGQADGVWGGKAHYRYSGRRST